MREILGVDIGGVIIDRVNDNTDTSFFGHNFLQTTATPDAFDVLRTLAPRFERIVLVSKCGQRIQDQTWKWLEHHDFYGKTGIHPEDVYFCLARRDKADICQRLNVTHFIDDRLEVLGYLTTVSRLYLFQPHEKEVRAFSQFLPRVTRVDSWKELQEEFLTAE